VARERSLVLPVLLTTIVGFGALSIDMFRPSLPAMTAAFGSDAATAQLTVLPNAMAGAIGPFPRMAGLAAAGACAR